MRKLSCLAVCLAFTGVSPQAQETYNQWAKYRVLTVNTTAAGGGANTSGDVRGFPLLVRLTSVHADVFAQSKTGGADLRFTKANGVARLAHEIEQWDSAGQSASIWVRLDTAYGNNNTQALRLYWGRSAAADSSSGAGVFRAADNYQGVWHLAGMNDATVNAHNGTNTNTTDTAGAVGRGRHFNGTNAYISLGNPAPMNAAAPFTIEGWVSWQSIGTGTTSRYRPLMTHGTSGTDGSQVFLQPRRPSSGGTDPYYSFGFYNGTVTNDAQAPALNDSGAWVHVTGAYDGTSWIVYRNGVRAATTARNGTVVHAANRNWFIGGGDGNNATTPSRFYFGKIDEVRFSDAARDSDWVRLNYETQKAGATALTVGATQTTAPVAISALAYGFPAKAADTLVLSQGAAANVAPTYNGGPVDSFKVVSGSLPAGLAVIKATGVLSGTPSAVTPAADVVIRAWGHATAGDSVSRTVRVSAAINALSNFRYNPDTTTYAPLLAVSNAPSWSGRAPTRFAVTAGTLPAGLVLDTATGVISGTPSAAAGAVNVTIRATNTAGPDTATRMLRLTVAAEDYATWGQRDTLWLNTTPGNGAGTTTAVTNFPVLVRLDSTAFASVYTQSVGRGADLRFLKGSTGTVRLPHQIESWDSAGRKAAVWVLVDTVRPNDRTQTFRVLWGKAGAQNASHGPSVFDTARGFRAVFHFSEGTSDTAFDATQYRFKAVPQRTATTYSFPEDTVGMIGRARRYGIGAGTATTNNAGSYFTVAGSAAPLDFPMGGPYTLSTWVIVNENGTSRTLFSKSDRQYAFERRNTGADWEFAEHNVPLGGWQVVGTPSTAGVWTHLVGVRNNNASALYLDGALIDTVPNSDATTTARITTTELNIGRSPDGGTNNAARYYWRGKLDEIRVAQTARSADWVKLEYENQKAAQSLVWLAQPPVVGIGGHSAARAAAAGFTAKPLGGGVLFQLQDVNEGRAVLSLTDMQGRAVWTGAFAPGASRLVWDGSSHGGADVSAGLYTARLTLTDKQGRAQVMNRKVPFTR